MQVNVSHCATLWWEYCSSWYITALSVYSLIEDYLCWVVSSWAEHPWLGWVDSLPVVILLEWQLYYPKKDQGKIQAPISVLPIGSLPPLWCFSATVCLPHWSWIFATWVCIREMWFIDCSYMYRYNVYTCEGVITSTEVSLRKMNGFLLWRVLTTLRLHPNTAQY